MSTDYFIRVTLLKHITPKAPGRRAFNGLLFKAVARWVGVPLFVKLTRPELW